MLRFFGRWSALCFLGLRGVLDLLGMRSLFFSKRSVDSKRPRRVVCLVGWMVCCVCGGVALPSASFASPLYQKGLRLYQSYEFQEAAVALQEALQKQATQLSPQQTLHAHLLLAVSFYNQAQPSAALRWFHQALALDVRAQIPPQQAPQVYQFFEQERSKWIAARSPQRPERRVVKRPIPPASPPFLQRHTASLILMGIALLATGVGVGVGIAYQGQASHYNSLRAAPQHNNGVSIEQAHQQANTTGLAATLLFASAGAIGLGAIVLFVFESRPIAPPQPASSESPAP